MNTVEEHWFNQFTYSLKRKKTVSSYRQTVELFLDFSHKNFVETEKSDVEQYINMLRKNKKAETSIQLYLSILSSFFNYLQENNVISSECKNFFSIYKPLDTHAPIAVEKIPTIEEIDSLLEAAKQSSTEYYLIIALAVKCGLSESEIYNLNIGDFFVDRNKNLGITVICEGKKRYVKLPKDIANIVNIYIKCSRSAEEKESPLFVSVRKSRLSARTIRYNIKRINEKAGISPAITLQDMRNFTAVSLLKSGVLPQDVATTLGISVSWITRYARAVNELDMSMTDKSNLYIKQYGN